ncbi:MAG: hypothetical protein SWO11_16940 [Thermodesulfobacteriota bacterium]|nr:hypothetical protein [Thermodesulfobacteriota bacterium]
MAERRFMLIYNGEASRVVQWSEEIEARKDSVFCDASGNAIGGIPPAPPPKILNTMSLNELMEYAEKNNITVDKRQNWDAKKLRLYIKMIEAEKEEEEMSKVDNEKD